MARHSAPRSRHARRALEKRATRARRNGHARPVRRAAQARTGGGAARPPAPRRPIGDTREYLRPEPLSRPSEPVGRAAARRRRRKPRGVPAPVRETLLWGCFGAVLSFGVIVASGAPLPSALAAAAGLLGLAVAAYGILRVTGMRLEHLHQRDQR